MSEELKIGEKIGEVRILPCMRCVGETRHTVRAAADVHGEVERQDGDFYWVVNNQLLECGGCGQITYRRAESDSDGQGPDDGEWDDSKLYPPRVSGRKALPESWMLEPKVRQIYKETANAIAAGSPILAGIGLRAILETVCQQKSAAGRNLLDKIDDLVTKQVLTPNGAAVLHQIRTLGNNSAHEVQPHSDKQLALAMDVIEHLLEDVYIINAKAARILPQVPMRAPAPIVAAPAPLVPPTTT
ncbi:DUF4145 domain-containing protein [Variovorax paradoxus]|uniref:DUF4145 domain-containing protein n=1 Tax=Variovorax paradoxus TaxID=34073 RepID=UPI003ECCC12F